MPVEMYQAENVSIVMELTDETSLNDPPGTGCQNFKPSNRTLRVSLDAKSLWEKVFQSSEILDTRMAL